MSLPPAVQSVLELFQGPLANVRFADVDAAGLAQLASEVEAATAEVEAREAALVELRQSLAQRHEALLALAQQALAYARVYAENNDDQLLEVIGAIALPRSAKPRKPSKATGSRDAAATELGATTHSTSAPETGSNTDAEPQVSDASEAASDDAPARTGRKGRPRAAHAAAS